MGVQREKAQFISYLLAVAVASFVFAILGIPGWPASRYDLPEFALNLSVMIVLTWVYALIPFLCVRAVALYWRLEHPLGSLIWGAFTGILYIPFGIALMHSVDFEGFRGDYSSDVFRSLGFGWWFYKKHIFAGSAGGFTYWLFAFSMFPIIIRNQITNVFHDKRPSAIFGKFLSRRVISRFALALILLGLSWGIHLWWRPHVDYSTSGDIPQIQFEHDFEACTRCYSPAGITWSHDGTKLAVKGQNDVWFMSWDIQGRIAEQIARPAAFDFFWASPIFLGNSSIVIANTKQTLFSVVDARTGEIIYEENNPSPGFSYDPEYRPNAFILSPDGMTIAVISGSKSGIPITFYSTKNWTKQRVNNLPATIEDQSGAFSTDGKQFAVGSGRKVAIIDVASRDILQTIPTRPTVGGQPFSFSPNGRLLAIATTDGEKPEVPITQGSIRIFQLSDGMEIATYLLAEATSGYVAWHPSGRFIVYKGEQNKIHFRNPFVTKPDEKIVQLPSI